jgi:hypothetical protein
MPTHKAQNAKMYENSKMYDNSMMYENSSMHDNSMMYDNSIIKNDTRLFSNTILHGDALCESTADYLILGPAKSSQRFTTAHRDTKIGIRINCGCFSGTIAEFEQAIETTHEKNPEFLAQYRGFVALIKIHFAHLLPSSTTEI